MSNRPRWLLAVALLAGAGGVIAATRLQPVADAARVAPPPGLAACAAVPRVGPGATARPGAFFKTAARLDPQGTLVGQALYVGLAGRILASGSIAAEASLSGPVDGVVVLATDDGQRSVVRLVSVGEGCSSTVLSASSVVRRAIADPADGSLLLHLVDRSTRSDLGVWRLPTGATEPVRLVEPLPASLGFGTVWATDLVLEPAGRWLAVQSCQDRACLTRLVDLADPTRAPIMLRDSRQGPMLGFDGERLVTWAACDGLPCALLAWEAGTTGPTDLVADATAAGLTPDGRLLVVVTADGPTEHGVVVDLTRGTARALHGLLPGDRPVARAGAAVAGLELAPGEIAVAQPAGDPHAIVPTPAGEVLP